MSCILKAFKCLGKPPFRTKAHQVLPHLQVASRKTTTPAELETRNKLVKTSEAVSQPSPNQSPESNIPENSELLSDNQVADPASADAPTDGEPAENSCTTRADTSNTVDKDKSKRSQVISEEAETGSGEVPSEKLTYTDRERTTERYFEALKLLKEATQHHPRTCLGDFEFPELDSEVGQFDEVQFKDKIEAILVSQQKSFDDKALFSKGKHLIQRLYTSLSPIARNFLMIASNAQSVQ